MSEIVYYLLGLWLAVYSFAGGPREVVVSQNGPSEHPVWVNVSHTTGDSHSPAMSYSPRLGYVIAWVDETRGPAGEVYFAHQTAAGWVNVPIPHTAGGFSPRVYVTDTDTVRVCFRWYMPERAIGLSCTTWLEPGWSSVDLLASYGNVLWLPLVPELRKGAARKEQP